MCACSGLTVDSMMKFAVAALSHSSGDVRQRAEDLIVALYSDPLGGQKVRGHLPPDTAATRRNVLYKQLFEAFEEVDRRPGGPVEMRVSGEGSYSFNCSLDNG